jgi:predicted  nucleic acid-binding Zn-ribbon protein
MEYYELYNALKADYTSLQEMHAEQRKTITEMVEEREKFNKEVMRLVVALEEMADTLEEYKG